MSHFRTRALVDLDTHRKRKNLQLCRGCLLDSEIGIHFITPDSLCTYEFARHLLYWSQRADQVAINFNKLTNNSAFDFVEGIFNIYQTTQDKDVIRDAIVDTSRLQKSIHRYEAEILQLAGVGTEWKQAASISKHVCDVVKWLEEILCLAMVDVEELSTAYKHQSLMYQA